MPGSAFNRELKIADGALQEVRGPVTYPDMTAIAIRIWQSGVSGTGGMAAAAGKPRLVANRAEIAHSWELPADGLLNAGAFVDGPALASAVAIVVDLNGSEQLIEWSQALLLTH